MCVSSLTFPLNSRLLYQLPSHSTSAPGCLIGISNPACSKLTAWFPSTDFRSSLCPHLSYFSKYCYNSLSWPGVGSCSIPLSLPQHSFPIKLHLCHCQNISFIFPCLTVSNTISQLRPSWKHFLKDLCLCLLDTYLATGWANNNEIMWLYTPTAVTSSLHILNAMTDKVPRGDSLQPF